MPQSNSKRRAIYPGTFDPVTNGHISLIERACQLFDEVIVAVSQSAGKNPLFTHEQRFKMMSRWAETAELDSIRVVSFSGLLADFASEQKAHAIIRGLRAISDFEVEFQMALMNRKLARDIETVFLMPALSWVYLSSTIVKEVALHGGDISSLVPPSVIEEFRNLQSKAHAK
jgi:pantetheine-phosphate adenylyltransferase